MGSEDVGRQWQLTVKRGMDVAGAVAGLVLLSPVLGIVAIVVRICLGRPVLFRQVRPGMNGHSFTLNKFRTMTDTRGADGLLRPDTERLTPLGRFLRKTSLDELPELWNVMKGDMSLVGPRPLLTEYLPRYTSEQARRHEMRSGITGWAQIHGRNDLSWEDKFKLDIWYIDHWSLWLDVRILARTFMITLLARGVSARGEATVSYFRGSSTEEGTE